MTNPPSPSAAFVDTGAFFALADNTDTHHPAAHQIRLQLGNARSRLFTTNFIRDEAYTLILAHLGYPSAISFLDTLAVSNINMIRLSHDDESMAEVILRRYSDKVYSFTDATSFAVMDRLNLTYAFAFDHNFEQYGKILLIP